MPGRRQRSARRPSCSLGLTRRLYFPARYSLNGFLLTLRSSTHWGCIQTLSNAGLSKAFCVNIIMHVLGFHSYLLFIFWLFSFAALPWSPPSQPDSCSAVCGRVRNWPSGRASTQAFLDCSKVRREAGQPAASTAGWQGGTGLRYVSSLVLSRFSCGPPFPPLALASRTADSSSCDFHKRGLGCRHITCLTAGRTWT